MKKVRRMVLLISMAAIMAMAIAGCSRKDKQASTEGFNEEKVYIRQGGLPDPALFIANQNSETGTNTFGDFAFEGLIRYQRGTDDIVLQLAESYENEGNKTIFKLRPNIKWSDGEAFTSKDIWAFYQICHNTPVNFLSSIETPDDLTVEFVWADPAPFDDFRIMLISQEVHHGRIPYHIYGDIADARYTALQKAPLLTQEQKAEGLQGPYGRYPSADTEVWEELDLLWKDYIKTPPNEEHIIVGTGPYINEPGHTLNEGSMVKNEYYWNPDGQQFDKVIIRATTDATKSPMMESEEIHNMDGTMPKDLTEALLKSNENIIYYPQRDPASHGLYFNHQSDNAPMDIKEFRQALIYIADKEAMRDIGSYQSDVHPWSSVGIPPSMLETYVDQDVIDRMTKYDHNEEKATELLESIGCEKINGKWHDPDGQQITITIGLDKGWYIATLVSPIYANQLNQFGIDTEVMAVDGTVYGQQSEVEHAFDMSWEWIDIAWSVSYPYFPLSNYYDYAGGPAKKLNLPINEKTNKTALQLTDWDNNTFDVWKWISTMPNEMDEKVRKDHWEKIIWATNENALAINFYENVTGAWENIKYTDKLPMMDKLTEDRWMPFPETLEERIAVNTLNWNFSSGVRKITELAPTTAKE